MDVSAFLFQRRALNGSVVFKHAFMALSLWYELTLSAHLLHLIRYGRCLLLDVCLQTMIAILWTQAGSISQTRPSRT